MGYQGIKHSLWAQSINQTWKKKNFEIFSFLHIIFWSKIFQTCLFALTWLFSISRLTHDISSRPYMRWSSDYGQESEINANFRFPTKSLFVFDANSLSPHLTKSWWKLNLADQIYHVMCRATGCRAYCLLSGETIPLILAPVPGQSNVFNVTEWSIS